MSNKDMLIVRRSNYNLELLETLQKFATRGIAGIVLMQICLYDWNYFFINNSRAAMESELVYSGFASGLGLLTIGAIKGIKMMALRYRENAVNKINNPTNSN